MNRDSRGERCPARLEISKAVSGMECLGWPPPWGKESGSGRTKERRETADLEIYQGSIRGGALSSGLPGGVRFAGEGLARCLRDRASGFGSLMGL
jgi:hypothetical protein